MDFIIPILLAIGKASLIGFSLAFVLFLWFSIKDRNANSSLITMTVVVFLSVIMRWYAPHLLALKTSLSPEYLMHILFIWYMGFVGVHACGILVIYKLHDAFAIQYSMIAKMVLVGYFVQGQLHMLRYSERLLLGVDSQWLKPIYQAGIGSVNIGMASISLAFALAIMVSRGRQAKGKRGLQWTL